ncbi:hypothetical protein VPH35_015243 [Triticum aestivum]
MASPQCCADPPTLNPAGGEGRVVDSFGGITAYVAGARESKAAVVLISDIFVCTLCRGLRTFPHKTRSPPFYFSHCMVFEKRMTETQSFRSNHSLLWMDRKIADKVASSGYFVVVPDFLHGDPYVPENADRPIQVWLKEHAPGKAFEEAKPVIAALKEQGVSTVGAAGYCWGAKGVAELAKANEIQAAVMSHPSFVTVDDIKEVKCPIAILGAETDKTSPPELVKQFEQVLSSSNSGIAHFVKIFPGVSHGWTVRYKSEDAGAVKSAEEALSDMIDWFNKNLK